MSFGAIFLCCKEVVKECGGSAGGRGGFGGLGGLGYHKKLDVVKGEGGGDCVYSTREVFAGSEEEEESDPDEVCDCSICRQVVLVNRVHAVEDEYREGAYSSGGDYLLLCNS